jgi:YVTN family beta-propeller protein
MTRIRPFRGPIAWVLSILITVVSRAEAPATSQVVGPANGGGYIVPTQQRIRPAGRSVEYRGRPVDVALAPDGKTTYVKDNAQLLAIDVDRWEITQQLKYPARPGGGTMHGIAVSRDGKRVYVTAGPALCEAMVGEGGKLTWGRTIPLPPTQRGKETAYPCGIALSRDGATAWVCLSIDNALAAVDLGTGKITQRIPVSVAPYDVILSADEKTAYVSNWGGRRPDAQDPTAKSAGAEALIDKRGVASSGTVGVVDLAAGKQVAEIEVGLHPSDLELTGDESRLYVANANSDTVSVIDTAARKVIATIAVRPDPTLPFGSGSNALALSRDERTLFVANGGNNAVAGVKLDPASGGGLVQGFIPAGWYPSAVALAGERLIIANVKGVGSRDPANEGKWNSHSYRGSVTLVDVPDEATLARYTAQVREDSRVPQSLRAWEKAQSGVAPVPVPKRVGEPSVFEHVVYVIKENRTYDQVFGDIGKGNSDPKLCVFGREITPNHHALAEQFALLDNFYCNGVVSADGHAWVTEGVTVDYLEKSFGAWARSYPFWGGDPLAFAPTGFIWDNVLIHGLSFRNYGEMVNSVTHPPRSTFTDVYRDYVNKTGKIRISNVLGLESIRPYTCEAYPGWNMDVPDQRRVDAFLAEFEKYKQTRDWPNLVIVYLPNDHTSGTNPGDPTPKAQVADNDYALGRVVDAVSHSEFWPKTCIFVIEDDPQAGFDHVDGHRSLCLVISPYTKRGAVVSNFYNQTSVLHTMELMLGVPPMNQLDAMAPVMEACFTEKPDLAPYTVLPSNVPFDQMNPEKSSLRGAELELAELSLKQRLEVPDAANEDALNRILWASARGATTPYPVEFAGAHGKGLKALGLAPDMLRRGARDADDGD